MIHKLECAGLGYHVKTEDSDDRLGMYSDIFNLKKSWVKPEVIEIGITRPSQGVIHLDE